MAWEVGAVLWPLWSNLYFRMLSMITLSYLSVLIRLIGINLLNRGAPRSAKLFELSCFNIVTHKIVSFSHFTLVANDVISSSVLILLYCTPITTTPKSISCKVKLILLSIIVVNFIAINAIIMIPTAYDDHLRCSDSGDWRAIVKVSQPLDHGPFILRDRVNFYTMYLLI